MDTDEHRLAFPEKLPGHSCSAVADIPEILAPSCVLVSSWQNPAVGAPTASVSASAPRIPTQPIARANSICVRPAFSRKSRSLEPSSDVKMNVSGDLFI